MRGGWTFLGGIWYFLTPDSAGAGALTRGKRGRDLKFKIFPREEGFYELFEQAAENLSETAQLLLGALTDFSDPEAAHAQIKRREHEGDEITHHIMRALNTSFVTPFDREDIHRLASSIDDIVDSMEAVADLMVLHNIDKPLPEMRQQAEVLARAAEQTHQAIRGLRAFSGLEKYWVEINRLENEGDRVYRKTVAQLFSGIYGAMDVL
jgi:predicted phosphate transport protein (TIGR00153 family)